MKKTLQEILNIIISKGLDPYEIEVPKNKIDDTINQLKLKEFKIFIIDRSTIYGDNVLIRCAKNLR